MKAEMNFILPEKLDSYHPTKQRFNMTFDKAYHAQAERMAEDLGVNLITLCRAIVAAGIASYKDDPAPFRAEAAQAKTRAAEATERRARDIRRAAEATERRARDIRREAERLASTDPAGD